MGRAWKSKIVRYGAAAAGAGALAGAGYAAGHAMGSRSASQEKDRRYQKVVEGSAYHI